jgi:hypothetical protein
LIRIVDRLRHQDLVARVEQRHDGVGQRSHQLLGPRDAVEVAAHRAQAVVDGGVEGLPVLELLQDRALSPASEHVARQEQHRDAIDGGGRGAGHQVGGARADRRGHRQRGQARVRLGEADRRVHHGLFVLAL